MTEKIAKKTGRVNLGLVLTFVIMSVLASCSGIPRVDDPERYEMAKTRLMDTWDLNRDGVISCADAVLKRDQQFTSTDLNDDGSLSLEEFAKADWSSRVFAAELFDQYDTDNNLKISLSELEARPDSAFLEMDENNDCVISDKELVKTLSTRSAIGIGRERGGRGQGDGGGRRRRN